MLQIKQVTITHKKDLRTLMENVSFVLNKGDKAAVIGEEGNGKSTLLKWIYDPRSVAKYAEGTGFVYKEGLKLGYLPQDLEPEQSQKSVYSFFAESGSFFDRTPKELKEISFRLGLKETIFYEEQKVDTLSGGEKIKIQLAKLLMERCDVYLLDEPSSDLDIETLKWLEQFICESEQPVLFISHDETLLEHTANVIIHLELVRRKTVSRVSVFRKTYGLYRKERAEQIEKQTREAAGERRQFEKQMEKFRQIEAKVEHRQNTVSRQDPHSGRLLKKKMKAVKSMEHNFERRQEQMTQFPDTEDAIFLKFDNSVFVPRGKCVLDLQMPSLCAGENEISQNIALTVFGGEKVCITGKNGSGKTTLLKEIARQLLNRTDIQAFYMPQDYEEQLCSEDTPLSFLSESAKKEELTKVRTLLGSLKYTQEEMIHPIKALSGGQKAKLFFIKMVLKKANVLILDEPTRNFSPLSNPVIREVLRAWRGTVISVSHDRKYIEEVCTKVYRLDNKGLCLL